MSDECSVKDYSQQAVFPNKHQILQWQEIYSQHMAAYFQQFGWDASLFHCLLTFWQHLPPLPQPNTDLTQTLHELQQWLTAAQNDYEQLLSDRVYRQALITYLQRANDYVPPNA